MKKAKLTILIATLLLGTMLFSACGGTVGNMDAYLNPDYVRSEYLYNDEDVVSELTGYGVTEIQGDLVVLANTEGLTTAYKVYNLAEKKVVASFTDTTLSYTVTLYKDVPAFVMASVKLEVEEGVDVETTYVLYDAQGKELTRTKYPPDAPMALNDTLMVYDYATYTVEANGSMEKKADIPESLIISNFFDANDNYIYARNSGVLAVYDYDFKLTATYAAPSYAQRTVMHVLNDGKILVQYMVTLPDDESTYDLQTLVNGEARKCDLVTKLIKPENGDVSDQNFDYLVSNLTTNAKLYDENDDNNTFNDKFQNIAVIARIEDRLLDESAAAQDIVLMNNDGKAESSLKKVSGQSATPATPIGEDLYMVSLLSGGSAVTDASGKVLHYLNQGVSLMGQNFVGNRAVYDLEMKEVYDLREKDATYLGEIQNTVFFNEKTDNGYVIKALYNGEFKTVYTYTKDSADNGTFHFLDGVGYYIVNAAGTEYTYYNAAGEKILSLAYELNVESISSDGEVVMLSGSPETQKIFHVFSIKD